LTLPRPADILPTAGNGRRGISVAERTSRATTVLDEIEALLRRGNKIAAIKLYRTATGVGLKEAKDTIDAVERAMREKDADHALERSSLGERADYGPGKIEVDRAKSPGLLASIFKALTRWRGQPD
jgi:hypothetical protein